MPMFGPQKYDLNPETLLYELSSEPLLRRLARYGLIFMVPIAPFGIYGTVMSISQDVRLSIWQLRDLT